MPNIPSDTLLILFTKYPKEGLVKTRLIPMIGAKNATALQKEMIEFTFHQCHSTGFPLCICYTGSDEQSIKNLVSSFLQKEHALQEEISSKQYFSVQNGNNIGARMENAFKEAFMRLFQKKEMGRKKVLLLGSDCPTNRTQNIIDALTLLDTHTCVLGPSLDGGYYQVGLSTESMQDSEKVYEALFHDISWGTGDVFAQSLQNLKKHSVLFSTVETLKDVDYYEDIPPKISVIIPTLNEEHNLQACLESLKIGFFFEIIVADGGSTDRTADIAHRYGCTVLSCKKGRSSQMLCGTNLAQGEILLFLHADSVVPQDWDKHIRHVMDSKNDNSLGYFLFDVEENFSGKKWFIKGTNFRANALKRPYGDQGLFVRKKDFETWDIQEIPMLEDVELVKTAKRHGKIVCTNSAIKTSGRRFVKHGLIKNIFMNQCVLLAAWCKMDLELIKTAYQTGQNPFILYFKERFK